MKLADIMTQLSCGEFSQIALGNEGGGIEEKNYKTVVAQVNLGLTALYRRFNLKEGRVVLQFQPGMLTYPLRSQYGVASQRSREPVRFLLDSDHPFTDDIHKIERVLTPAGTEMSLNDRADPYSLYTPNMMTLLAPKVLVDGGPDLPDWLKVKEVTVVYRANHPIITIPIGPFDPARVDIELPYSHLEALLYFVASRVHNPIGMSNEFHAGNNYAMKYEAVCAELERVNMRIDQVSQPNRLVQKGFV